MHDDCATGKDDRRTARLRGEYDFGARAVFGAAWRAGADERGLADLQFVAYARGRLRGFAASPRCAGSAGVAARRIWPGGTPRRRAAGGPAGAGAASGELQRTRRREGVVVSERSSGGIDRSLSRRRAARESAAARYVAA